VLSPKALLVRLRSIVELPTLDVRNRLRSNLRLRGEDDDLGAVSEEGTRSGEPDTVRTAGDDVDAVGEVGYLMLLELLAGEEGGDEVGHG
jgi:hypothetical protein